MSLDAKSWVLLIGLAAVEITVSSAVACPDSLKFLEPGCAQWQSKVLPQTIPASAGNALADSESAAALGMKVFYDNRFSKSGSGVACSNCHDPEHTFAEQKPTSHTIGEVGRNAPDLINAVWYTRSHFWDGKVDNLWSAPLFTFEQGAEMGSSRLAVAHTIATIYKPRYEKIFGPMPDLSDVKRFPLEGMPGTAAFDSMSESDKLLINQVYANVGKSLEAYIRKLAAGRAPFDDFMGGNEKSISPDAQRGMTVFTKFGCDACHSGPTFTDEAYHNLGYPATAGAHKDLARAGGKAIASTWQFKSDGKFADHTGSIKTEEQAHPKDDPKGFRTPTLRNVELTAPYGHDGAFATLDLVIRAHVKVLPAHAYPDGQDEHDLLAFLHSLNGRPPQRPWNYWPGG